MTLDPITVLRDAPNALRAGPLTRVVVDAASWDAIAQRIGGDRRYTLVSLWADVDHVHVAVADESAGSIAVVSTACENGRFPSVGRHHAPAIRLERAVRDLWGHEPIDAPDRRKWLDHGRWDVTHPLGRGVRLESDPFGKGSHAIGNLPAGSGSSLTTLEAEPYRFLAAEGEALHQIPVGPVHAGIIEPGHFRFTAAGETIVRLEERLGYVHKGIDALMAGRPLDRAARVAARTSGDSTVAYSLAFARAVESALGVEVPVRAVYLRAIMAELERVANHLGDFGAICNDASFSIMHAHCGILREHVLRAAASAFGHRLMMDRVVPGGVAVDVDAAGTAAITALTGDLRVRLPALVDLYDNTASLQDRTAGTGRLSAELAQRFGAGGYVGRASGRAFDARKFWRYPPYDDLEFTVPVHAAGDVDARVWVRIEEIEQSLSIVEHCLAHLLAGPISTDVPAPAQVVEGVAATEAFRGDVLAWVRIDASGVAASHLRDASWFLWPLLEAVVEGNIVADFPLCNKSFNCSYSGHDL